MGRVVRFSRLNNALKDGAAKTGAVLSKYLATRPGGTATPNTVKSTKRLTTQKRQLSPFGFPIDPATTLSTPLVVTGSGRSMASGVFTATTVSEAELGLDAVATGTKRNQSFIPAKAIFAKRRASVKPVANAYYTGLPYNNIIEESFTQPFGQVAGKLSEFQQQATIKGKIGATAFSVSFQPERLYA